MIRPIDNSVFEDDNPVIRTSRKLKEEKLTDREAIFAQIGDDSRADMSEILNAHLSPLKDKVNRRHQRFVPEFQGEELETK